MATKDSPLIFIHKSNIKDSQEYLYDVFDVATHFNPDMEIYLLGDDNNRHYADRAGIKFEYYDDYSSGEEIEEFEDVFEVVRGPQHGSEEWIEFVFKRWFHIYNFLKEKKYSKFWTFDSDNLVISNLKEKEERFAKYDCTEQCNGACINGFVSNLDVVRGYLNKINELFDDDFYLNKQRNEFNTLNPTYAFTEMRAYAEYKKKYSTVDGMSVYPAAGFKSILLQSIIDGETFDPCLAQNSAKKILLEDNDSGFEMEGGIKKLYFSDGKIYQKFVDTGELVKVNSINMSWINQLLWSKIINYVKV